MSKIVWHLHVGVMPADLQRTRSEARKHLRLSEDLMVEGSWTDWGEVRKDGEAFHVMVESSHFTRLVAIATELWETGLLVAEPMDDASYWFITTREDWSEVLIRGSRDGKALEIRPGAWG